MIAFIDEHRDAYGVEPICRVLPIAPSSYHERVAQRRDPGRRSARSQRDEGLKPEVMRVFAENFGVYGVRKVWRQMKREGFDVARCSVARLMRDLGLQGVIRGKPVRTTISDKAAACPLDHVNRQFHAPAPNRLWVSDFTYVATWAGLNQSTHSRVAKQRGALHRVHAGIDANMGGDVGKLADLRISDLGVFGAIGIVAHARTRHGTTRPHLGVSSQNRV